MKVSWSKQFDVAENEAIKFGSSALATALLRRRSHFQNFSIRTQSSPDPSNFAGGLTLRWSFHDIFNFKKISPVAEIALSEALCAEDE